MIELCPGFLRCIWTDRIRKWHEALSLSNWTNYRTIFNEIKDNLADGRKFEMANVQRSSDHALRAMRNRRPVNIAI